MRILHLVSYPLYSGPIPPTLQLAQAQQQLGHTVWLAHNSQRGDIAGYEEAANPALSHAKLLPPVSIPLSSKSTPQKLWQATHALRHMCLKAHVDVIHSHLSHDHGLATWVLKLLPHQARPCHIRTVHADRSLTPRFAQAWLLRQTTGFVVRCSKHQDTLEYRFGIAQARIARIPGSVDTTRFTLATSNARQQARAKLGLPQDKPVLGHVALIDNRGQQELLHALSLLGQHAPHVMWVGRGAQETALKNQAQQAGLSHLTHFVGYQQGIDLVAAYHAMDAAFVAQPGNDASCRAALEAMAAGLPVLAIQTGSLAETIDETRGYPIYQRTPENIAQAISQWQQNLPGGSARGLKARQYVQQEHTIHQEAQSTQALYERLMYQP